MSIPVVWAAGDSNPEPMD